MNTRSIPTFERLLRSPARHVCALLFACIATCGAHAATRCAPTERAGMERCITGVAPSAVREIQEQQKASNWCWAASISMLLASGGVRVPQEEVVREHFGTVVNERVTGKEFHALLNRSWHTPSGEIVETAARPVAPWWGQLGLMAPDVLADLEQGRPLVLGLHEHAVLLVEVTFERQTGGNPGSYRLLRAGVLDPANGLRSLRREEIPLEFVTRVAVERHPETAANARELRVASAAISP